MNSPRGFFTLPVVLSLLALLALGGVSAYFYSQQIHLSATERATFSVGVPVSLVPGQSLTRGNDTITFSRFGSYFREQENSAPVTVPEAYLITASTLSGT